jgi:hypothetical protein
MKLVFHFLKFTGLRWRWLILGHWLAGLYLALTDSPAVVTVTGCLLALVLGAGVAPHPRSSLDHRLPLRYPARFVLKGVAPCLIWTFLPWAVATFLTVIRRLHELPNIVERTLLEYGSCLLFVTIPFLLGSLGLGFLYLLIAVLGGWASIMFFADRVGVLPVLCLLGLLCAVARSSSGFGPRLLFYTTLMVCAFGPRLDGWLGAWLDGRRAMADARHLLEMEDGPMIWKPLGCGYKPISDRQLEILMPETNAQAFAAFSFAPDFWKSGDYEGDTSFIHGRVQSIFLVARGPTPLRGNHPIQISGQAKWQLGDRHEFLIDHTKDRQIFETPSGSYQLARDAVLRWKITNETSFVQKGSESFWVKTDPHGSWRSVESMLRDSPLKPGCRLLITRFDRTVAFPLVVALENVFLNFGDPPATKVSRPAQIAEKRPSKELILSKAWAPEDPETEIEFGFLLKRDPSVEQLAKFVPSRLEWILEAASKNTRAMDALRLGALPEQEPQILAALEKKPSLSSFFTATPEGIAKAKERMIAAPWQLPLETLRPLIATRDAAFYPKIAAALVSNLAEAEEIVPLALAIPELREEIWGMMKERNSMSGAQDLVALAAGGERRALEVLASKHPNRLGEVVWDAELRRWNQATPPQAEKLTQARHEPAWGVYILPE